MTITVTQHRLLIDIQFTVDENEFKLAQLSDDATGVSEVTDAGVRDVVAGRLIGVDWAGQGLAPLRSIVTTRMLTASGNYARVSIPADPSVTTG